MADYDALGHGYARGRCTDSRWMATIDDALGSAGTVVNVGAGTGSYEPSDRQVVAVEPSAVMLGQRPRVRHQPYAPSPRRCPSPTRPSTWLLRC